MDSTALDLLERAVKLHGEEFVKNELARLCAESPSQDLVLTIIANQGVHHLPKQFVRGEMYVAHEGSFDFSVPERTREQIREVLVRLTTKLKSKPYQTIYLIPFGHSVLSMQIKLLVYRVCHIETIDLFYVGGGEYFDYQEDLRELILKAEAGGA